MPFFNNESSPLCAACMEGHEEVAKALLERGALTYDCYFQCVADVEAMMSV